MTTNLFDLMAQAASDLGEALSPYVCAVVEQIEQLKDLNR